jgi:hypothetical protein
MKEVKVKLDLRGTEYTKNLIKDYAKLKQKHFVLLRDVAWLHENRNNGRIADLVEDVYSKHNADLTGKQKPEKEVKNV